MRRWMYIADTAKAAAELLIDADAERVGVRHQVLRVPRNRPRDARVEPRGKNDSTRLPTMEPPGTSKNRQSVPGYFASSRAMACVGGLSRQLLDVVGRHHRRPGRVGHR